jgi:hypothetical protein
MTSITIQLVQGKNYISFPATSVYNFRTIFTDSGIMNGIGIDSSQNKMFYRYDPISNDYIPIDLDIEHIEQGKGYYLYAASASPGIISYDGIEYTITFDQFKSRIVKGWNILGVGKDIIVPKTWCKILDPVTMIPVTILESKHSYLVNYDECIMSTASYGTTIAVIASTLVAFAILKQFKVL